MEKKKIIKCPWCGKKVSHYKCSNGEFYGCTGYPKCNFKKNIKYIPPKPQTNFTKEND